METRRREIEDVLNPGRRITYPHVDRAIHLAMHYKWNVKPAARGDLVYATHRNRTIFTTPICGDTELASFIHEGGHIEDPDWGLRHADIGDGGWRNSFDAELFAWRFSLQRLGSLWNSVMNAHMNDCLWSYRPNYVRTNENRLAMESLLAEGEATAKRRIYLPGSPAERERQQRLALVEAAVTRCRGGNDAR